MRKFILKIGNKKINSSDSFILEFYDYVQLIKRVYEISSEIIEEIILKTNEVEHYYVYNDLNIEFLIDNQIDYNKYYIILLGTTILEQKFGMFFTEGLKNSYRLLGLWPHEFIEELTKDKNLLLNYLTDIIKEPDSFYDISILLFKMSP